MGKESKKDNNKIKDIDDIKKSDDTLDTEELTVEDNNKVADDISDRILDEAEAFDEKLMSEISKEDLLEKENAELKEKAIRSAAEFDNFRKRTTKEKQAMYSEGVKDTIEKLLSVIDNFDRAMAAEGVDKKDNFYIGMEMIHKQFNAILTDLGIKEVGAAGDEFDPTYHFAVAKEDSDEFEENQISLILQKGYMLNDKVIRPAMVKVAN